MIDVDSKIGEWLPKPSKPSTDRPHDPDCALADVRSVTLVKAVAPYPPRRHFLLVCGPFGPFTRQLAESLRHAGAMCSRVVLNGGDIYDWGLAHTRIYPGRLAGFDKWLADTMARDGVTDIIIYGDTHPYCVAAARVASALALRIHVLEQGYFRPFWITLEANGVNGNSGLPRSPEIYRREAACLPEPAEVWLPPLTPPAAWKISLYHSVLLLTSPAFPFFRPPYQYSIVHQGLSHARRYIDQRLFRGRHQRALRAALKPVGPLFIGILQRPGDSQLRLHSRFRRTADFIAEVVASFARHAPADARLLFKSHPLDHGIEPHGRSVRMAAAAHGVAGRVFFVDTGDLNQMIPLAAGAVTVNSTAGLSVIERGLPTVVLGTAIYDMPGLTHQHGLDSFWTAPEAPDPRLYQAFRKVVIHRTQIAGAFASRQGVEMAAPEVARRVLACTLIRRPVQPAP